MSRILQALALVLLVLLSGTPDSAQAAPELPTKGLLAQNENAQIDFKVVLAHNGDSEVDSALSPLAGTLRRLPFTGFNLLSSGTLSVCAGCVQSTTLQTGQNLTVTLNSFDASSASVRVQVSSNPPIDTTITVARGGTFLLGGPPHGNGSLVLPLSVR